MKTTYFILPGMFSPFINCFLGTYFIDQMEYLKKNELEHFLLPLDTEATIESNAKIIRDYALRHQNVMAFTHSKGGVDLLHCLITYPEVRKRFKKIVFMQAPFFGTPLADVAHANKMARLITKGVFKIGFRGDPESANELRTTYRHEYMNKHAGIIEKIINELNIECMASSKNHEPGRFDSILKIPRDFMEKKFNVPNDGMIPRYSAILPGAKLRLFEDLDHASAVLRLTPQEFDRWAFSHEIFSGV